MSALLVAPTGGSVVPSDRGGAVEMGFCGGAVGIGGSERPRPGGGVGGGGKRLRGACPASPGGGTGVKNGFAPAPFGAPMVPTGGGVGVPAGIGTMGMACDGEDPRVDGGGGP